MRIQWKPDFIEEAVFVTVKTLDERSIGDAQRVRCFHEEKDVVYENTPGSGKNIAFQKFYEKQFISLGLHSFFSDLLEEFPCFNHPSLKFLGRRAWSRKEEGAELFVHDGMKSVVLKLQTLRVQDLESLATYLRHELMHISDMLDPDFDYSPHATLGGAGEVENNLIRDRFGVLWDLYASCRIQKKGGEVLIPFEKQRSRIDKAFTAWPLEIRESIFEEVLRRPKWTQGELLDVAKGLPPAAEMPQVSDKCSLCGFPSRDDMQHWTESDAVSVVSAIQKDRPDWKPVLKTCRQCFEMYRVQLKVEIGS